MGLLDELKGRAHDGVRGVRSMLDGLVDQANTRLDQAEARIGLTGEASTDPIADAGEGRTPADVEVIEITRHPRRPTP